MCFLASSSRVSDCLESHFPLLHNHMNILNLHKYPWCFLAYLVVEACTGSTSELKACVVKAEEVQNLLDENVSTRSGRWQISWNIFGSLKIWIFQTFLDTGTNSLIFGAVCFAGARLRLGKLEWLDWVQCILWRRRGCHDAMIKRASGEDLSNLEVQSEEIALWCKHQMLVAKHVNQRPKRQDLSFSHENTRFPYLKRIEFGSIWKAKSQTKTEPKLVRSSCILV